jgi:hypothetical protein
LVRTIIIPNLPGVDKRESGTDRCDGGGWSVVGGLWLVVVGGNFWYISYGKVPFGQFAVGAGAMMRAPTVHKLTPVDTSGRISLGKARAGSLYDVAFEEDGRVVLTPMVAIPARELWLHKNPTAKAMVETGLSEMGRAETVSIDLSAFPEDDDEE